MSDDLTSSTTLSNQPSTRLLIENLIGQAQVHNKNALDHMAGTEAEFTYVVAIAVVILKKIKIASRDEEVEFLLSLNNWPGYGMEHQLLNRIRNQHDKKLGRDTKWNSRHSDLVLATRWLNRPTNYRPDPETIDVESVVEFIRDKDPERDPLGAIEHLAKLQADFQSGEGRRVKQARQAEQQAAKLILAREEARKRGIDVDNMVDAEWYDELTKRLDTERAEQEAANATQRLKAGLEKLVEVGCKREASNTFTPRHVYVCGSDGRLYQLKNRFREALALRMLDEHAE